MSQNLSRAIAVIGIDIGKNSFHVVGLDERGAIAVIYAEAWHKMCQKMALNVPPRAARSGSTFAGP